MYTDLFKTSNFRIQTRDSKHIDFFCQEASLPGYSIGEITLPFQSMKDHRPGDSIEFEPLSLTILCDEDLLAWKNVYDYLNLTHDAMTNRLEVQQEVFDATLFLTTNKNNIKYEIKFYDAWFQSVSPLQFQTISTDENNITFTVGIVYNYYKLKVVK